LYRNAEGRLAVNVATHRRAAGHAPPRPFRRAIDRDGIRSFALTQDPDAIHTRQVAAAVRVLG
jgi:hypothetical protein